MHNDDAPSRVFQITLRGMGRISFPNGEEFLGKILGNFARKNFLLGGGCLRSDFDHSDLLKS